MKSLKEKEMRLIKGEGINENMFTTGFGNINIFRSEDKFIILGCK